jgi:hypothetical protein
VSSVGTCGLVPNVLKPIHPVVASRLIWNKHARPDGPSGPYRQYYYVNTPWRGVSIDATVRVTPVVGQAKPYAVHLSVKMSMPTGQAPPAEWPHLAFNFINHPNGDMNIVNLEGVIECEKVVYSNHPRVQVSDVYVVPL